MNQSRPDGLNARLDQSVLKAYDLGTIPEAQMGTGGQSPGRLPEL